MYAEVYGIWPTERFVALPASRGRVGTPPQKPWLANMELCCRRLALNAVDSQRGCKTFVKVRYGMVAVLPLRF